MTTTPQRDAICRRYPCRKDADPGITLAICCVAYAVACVFWLA